MDNPVRVTRLIYSPQWIRTIDRNGIHGWYDRQNDTNVWSLESQDVDVSDDGEVWFHLVGPRCHHDLRSWSEAALGDASVPIVAAVPKPNLPESENELGLA